MFLLSDKADLNGQSMPPHRGRQIQLQETEVVDNDPSEKFKVTIGDKQSIQTDSESRMGQTDW